jgi:hypothetical protein
MKTLTIADLARSEQLDRPTMAAVRGGWKIAMPSYPPGGMHHAPKLDASVAATQDLAQLQDVVTATANGAAFVDGVGVDSHVAQDGNNRIVRR